MRRLLLFVLLCAVVANAAAALTFTTHFPAYRPPQPEALIVSPADPNVVYEIAHDTLYRSSDGGATFTMRSRVSSLVAVDPFDPNLLYDAVGPRRSDDGGVTWTLARDGMPSVSPASMMIVVTPRGTIFISSNCYIDHIGGGLFRSDDRAASWSANLVEAGKCVGNFSVDPISEALYPSYEYDSSNSHPVGTFPSIQIVASPRNPDVRYAIGTIVRSSSDSEVAVLGTTDGAKSWQRLTVDGTPRVLGLDEGSGRVFLATSNGLFFSDDRGVSWPRVAGAPAVVNNIVVAGSVLYVATPAASYRAPMATLGPFTPLGPLPADQSFVSGLAIDPNRGILYAAGGGAWRSLDRGQHWETIDDGTVQWQPAVDGAGDFYTLTFRGNHIVSLRHYAPASGTWDMLPTPFEQLMRLVASPARAGLLYAAGDGGFFISNDGGRAWRQVPEIGTSASDVAVDASQPDVVYVAGTNGLFVSADGGTVWRRLDAAATSAILVAPSRPATLYRISRPYWFNPDELQRSDDGGTTWRNLRTAESYSLAVDPLDAGSVWFGALEHSLDGGTTWTKELGGLSEDTIGGYVIDRDGTHLHVYLNSKRLTGEYDALLRVERRRVAAH